MPKTRTLEQVPLFAPDPSAEPEEALPYFFWATEAEIRQAAAGTLPASWVSYCDDLVLWMNDDAAGWFARTGQRVKGA